LKIGNVWYYQSYVPGSFFDSTKYNEMWQVVRARSLDTRTFFLVRMSHYNTVGSIVSVDSVYYSDAVDSLLQIFPEQPFVSSSISILALVSPSAGSFDTQFAGIPHAAYISARTENTVSIVYTPSGHPELGFQYTFKKSVGLTESQSGYGVGKRLVKYQLG
jgi:hypothetical protein